MEIFFSAYRKLIHLAFHSILLKSKAANMQEKARSKRKKTRPSQPSKITGKTKAAKAAPPTALGDTSKIETPGRDKPKSKEMDLPRLKGKLDSLIQAYIKKTDEIAFSFVDNNLLCIVFLPVTDQARLHKWRAQKIHPLAGLLAKSKQDKCAVMPINAHNMSINECTFTNISAVGQGSNSDITLRNSTINFDFKGKRYSYKIPFGFLVFFGNDYPYGAAIALTKLAILKHAEARGIPYEAL